MKPNLYRWATSELSQDAFICWLLEWASLDYADSKIHKVAIRFIHELSGIDPKTIRSIDIRRQYKGIDILIIVNDLNVILIEDKVHASNHSNQLRRYAELMDQEFNTNNVSMIYLKTGDQSDYSFPIKRGYSVYKRKDFIKLLQFGRSIGVESDIFLDFLNHLIGVEESINSYEILPVSQWHWNSWRGFFIKLQDLLGEGEWDYVPQKDGGFVGFWWNWKSAVYKGVGFDYYLQLEFGKFCFKIYPSDVKVNYEIRSYFREVLFPVFDSAGIEIERNGRCIKGKTQTMTVAKLSEGYIVTDANGLILLQDTLNRIKMIEHVFKKLGQSLS